jgi:hypothetical protein
MPNKISTYSSTQNLLHQGGKSKKKSFKNFTALRLVLIFLVIVGLASLFYYIFLLNSIIPSTSLSSQAQQRLLIQRDSLKSTLIVLEDSDNVRISSAWYVIYNEKNLSTVVYYIPTGIYMKEYLSNVADYVSVGDLKYVGDTIEPKRKYEYAVWQLGNLTGITPDSYIWINSDSLKSFNTIFGNFYEFEKEEYIPNYTDSNEISGGSLIINSMIDRFSYTKLVLNFTDFSSFVHGIDTNLSQTQLLRRFEILDKALSTQTIDMLDLSQPWATKQITNESGRKIDLVNYDKVDEKLGLYVKDLKGRDIEREQVKIEVYNASEIEGLASRYSRKFENSGIEVVRFENAPNTVEKTEVYISKKDKYPVSLSIVSKLLVVETSLIDGRPDFMTTADIVVILGKDMKNEASWK